MADQDFALYLIDGEKMVMLVDSIRKVVQTVIVSALSTNDNYSTDTIQVSDIANPAVRILKGYVSLLSS